MTRQYVLAHQFVHYVPEQLEAGVLYVSLEYATAAHLCPCGCGEEIVTTLSPTDWSLIFDGEAVSLEPSIGNWSLKCQSHYWVRRGRVVWAPKWTRSEIDEGRRLDREAKRDHYQSLGGGSAPGPARTPAAVTPWWRRWIPWK